MSCRLLQLPCGVPPFIAQIGANRLDELVDLVMRPHDNCHAAGLAHLLAGLAQAEAGTGIGLDVDLVLGSKFRTEVIEQDLIKVSAAEVAIPCVGEDPQLTLLEGHYRDLPATTTIQTQWLQRLSD